MQELEDSSSSSYDLDNEYSKKYEIQKLKTKTKKNVKFKEDFLRKHR